MSMCASPEDAPLAQAILALRIETCSSRSLHLRQRCFRLRQPEGHVHGSVKRDGSGEISVGLLSLAARGIQRAQAAVAVGLEGAHAEFLGQGEGLAVVGFGWLTLWGIAMRCNVAKEVQGICLVATFLVLAGMR